MIIGELQICDSLRHFIPRHYFRPFMELDGIARVRLYARLTRDGRQARVISHCHVYGHLLRRLIVALTGDAAISIWPVS